MNSKLKLWFRIQCLLWDICSYDFRACSHLPCSLFSDKWTWKSCKWIIFSSLLMRRSWVRYPLWQPAPYWSGMCQYIVTGWDRSHGLSALSHVGQHVKLSDGSFGTCPQYNVVADEDVKKTNSDKKNLQIQYSAGKLKTLKTRTTTFLWYCIRNSKLAKQNKDLPLDLAVW